MIFINYFRKTTDSSTATNNTSLTIWFRINVLSGTNSIRKDVLFRENVLDGTKRESATSATHRRRTERLRATETASAVSILPREMSRSDRGVRHREARSSHGKKAAVLTNHSLFSVRAKGLEPIRTRHQILSLAWLPITTRSQFPPEGS